MVVIQPGRDHIIGEAFICEEDNFARITSQYGDVYFLAIDSSVCRSSLERFTLNGLFPGIRDTIPLMQSPSDYVTVHLQQANRRSADIRSHPPTAGRQRTDEEAQPAKRRLLRADSSEAGRIGIAVHSAPG